MSFVNLNENMLQHLTLLQLAMLAGFHTISTAWYQTTIQEQKKEAQEL